MKLLLLNPYFGDVKDRASEAATNAPPLGLGYLATYVRDHSDCEVEIVDPVPQRLDESEVLRKVQAVDMVGLGCFTDTRFICFDFARKVKQVNRDCFLVIGGPFVYFLDELILEHNPFVDVIVRGEGEHTVLDLIKNKPLSEIKGITYKEDSRIVRNPDRPLEKDVNKFYVDYSLLPDVGLYRSDIEGDFRTKGLRTAYMILSRGCPFRCTYCANDHWQRKWRIVSPEAAVSQIRTLKEQHGVEFIRFYDDLFTLRESWVYKFCELINEQKIDIQFRVLSRVGVKEEVLSALKSVGCTGVGLGIESGSDRMLKRIRKGFSSRQAVETLRLCRKLKLWTVCSFIISLPDETEEDRNKTICFTHLCDFFVINILHLHPGTPLYNELKERGQINDEVWFDRNMPTTIHYCRDQFSSANLRFAEAQWISLKARYYEFLFHPCRKLKQYGILLGLLWTLFAIIDVPLKGRLYKWSFLFKDIYRRLLWRS